MAKTKKAKYTNRGAEALRNFFQSQNDGARRVGIGGSAFSLLLAGKRRPSIEVAARIERLYGVPCAYWVEDVEIISKDKDR